MRPPVSNGGLVTGMIASRNSNIFPGLTMLPSMRLAGTRILAPSPFKLLGVKRVVQRPSNARFPWGRGVALAPGSGVGVGVAIGLGVGVAIGAGVGVAAGVDVGVGRGVAAGVGGTVGWAVPAGAGLGSVGVGVSVRGGRSIGKLVLGVSVGTTATADGWAEGVTADVHDAMRMTASAGPTSRFIEAAP
jgi:hypothetical protein